MAADSTEVLETFERLETELKARLFGDVGQRLDRILEMLRTRQL